MCIFVNVYATNMQKKTHFKIYFHASKHLFIKNALKAPRINLLKNNKTKTIIYLKNIPNNN